MLCSPMMSGFLELFVWAAGYVPPPLTEVERIQLGNAASDIMNDNASSPSTADNQIRQSTHMHTHTQQFQPLLTFAAQFPLHTNPYSSNTKNTDQLNSL
jgi:hypothetical protein